MDTNTIGQSKSGAGVPAGVLTFSEKNMVSASEDVDNAPSPTSHSPTRPRKLHISLWLILLLSLSIIYAIFRSHSTLQLDLGTWGCRMSWMSPNYIKMDGPRREGMGGLEDKYSLWLYREGGLQGHVEPTGQPVLFIPGNAGSSKQVRSIASSAAHQYFDSRSHPDDIRFRDRPGVPSMKDWKELDFYTVDFNEEFSAFHSASIQDQAHYVAHAIRYIVARYDSPRHIVLLGHSMGGIVARLSLTLVQSGYDVPRDNISELVAAIITMSTPHAMPPVSIDRGMEKLYSDINIYWEQDVQVPVLVSICGGTADTQISSDACVLPGYSADKRGGSFSVFTTGIHGIWTGVDHQAMVWCDQIRSRVARAVLGLHSVLSQHGKSKGEAEMVKILRTEFLGSVPSGILVPSAFSPRHPEAGWTVLEPNDPVIRGRASRTFAIECFRTGSEDCIIQMLGQYSIRGIGPEGKPSLEIYTDSQSGHTQRENYGPAILDTIQILPPSAPFSSHMEREAFPVPGEGGRADAGLTFIQARFSGIAHIRADEGSWAVVGMPGDPNDQGWKPLRREWHFDRLDHSLLAYRLTLDKRKKNGCSELLSPIVRHTTKHGRSLSETHERRHYPQANVSLLLHSHSAAAPFVSTSSGKGYSVEVFQDPSDTCWIDKVYLSIDWAATPGLSVLRYRTAPIAWAIGWIALTWAHQLRKFRSTGIFPAFSIALANSLSQEVVLMTLAIVVVGVVQSSPLGRILPGGSERYLLGNTSWTLLPLIPPALVVAYGLVWLSHIVLLASLRCWSATIGRFSQPTRYTPSDATLLVKQRVIGLMGLFALLWLFVPYQFAFVIIFMMHFSTAASSHPDASLEQYHSLLLMMLWLLSLTAPTVLVWVRGIAVDWRHAFRFGSHWGLFEVMGFALLCEGFSGGRIVTIRDSKLPELASIAVATYSFFLGPRYTYGIYMAVNVLVGVLVMQVYRRVSDK